MTPQQMIATISEAFGKLDRMDPGGPIYAKLCALLDRADDEALKAAYAAKIKFVSPLAFNRMIRRGLV
jgi:hypothetical protein